MPEIIMSKNVRVIVSVVFEKSEIFSKQGVHEFTLVIEVYGLPDPQVHIVLPVQPGFINNGAGHHPSELLV